MTCLAQQAEAKLVVLVILSCTRAIDFGSRFTPYLHIHIAQASVEDLIQHIFIQYPRNFQQIASDNWK